VQTNDELVDVALDGSLQQIHAARHQIALDRESNLRQLGVDEQV